MPNITDCPHCGFGFSAPTWDGRCPACHKVVPAAGKDPRGVLPGTFVIEIHERAGCEEVVETMETETMALFREYWHSGVYDHRTFNWRIVKGPKGPEPKRNVRKEDARRALACDPKGMTLELNPELLRTISQFNGYMAPGDIERALLDGKSVYTEFSRYTLED